MVRLGGPVFISTGPEPDPEALVRVHRTKGFRAAYAPPVRLEQRDLVRDIRRAFEAADIVMAEVGYWKNPLHLDAQEARTARQEMLDALALAEELGALCMVCNLGSFVADTVRFHSERNFSDDAFDAAVETARFLIDAVKPTRAFFTYEMFPFNVNDHPEGVLRLIRAVDRGRFGAHMDLVNLVNCPRAYYDSGAIIRRCTELFGDRIVSAHAKDVILEMPSISVLLREVPPGEGNLDYAAYLRCLNELPRDVPLMMEHMKSENEYDRAAAYIRSVAAKESIPL